MGGFLIWVKLWMDGLLTSDWVVSELGPDIDGWFSDLGVIAVVFSYLGLLPMGASLI